ncbi:MAG: DNA repair protein RecO [Bacilli bacterium]|nr:DNA repair protein RecO [Bacilli bacterium]
MIKKIEGIIVSELDYKESSKIINVLTNEYGIIGLIAKGTKKINSPLSSVTSKLTYGYFHIKYKENGLSTLLEVDVINKFKNIKKDINLMSYSLYLLELSSSVYKHSDNLDVYKLLIDSLIKIEEGYDYQVISNIFELKMLDYLGIKPIIDECVNCGNKVDIVTISSYKGGYLCKNCARGEVIVNIKTIKLLRMFYYVDISKISKLDVSPNIKKELSRFIYDYYDRYSGIYLKSREFLQNLDKLNN